MAVLETFQFLFESDASKVDAGAKSGEQSLKRMTDAANKADNAVNKTGNSFLAASKSVAGFLGGFLAVGTAITQLRAAADFADEMNDVADALDVGVEKLHLWNNAAWSTGGSSQGFQQSMLALNDQLQQVAATGTGRALPMLEKLGFSLAQIKLGAKDPIAFTDQLADKFEKLSKVEATAIGKKLGLDQGTINLLLQGRVALDDIIKRQEELGLVTKEDAEIAAQFNDQMDDMSKLFQSIRQRASTSILPALTWVLKGFESVVQFFRRNDRVVTGFFIGLAGILTTLYLPAMIRAAVATWALIAPFALVAGAVLVVGAAFALLYDDVMAFLAGNNSVIGELSKKWPVVGEIVRGVAEFIKLAFDQVMGTLRSLATLVTEGPEAAFKAWQATTNAFIDGFVTKFPRIADVVRTVGGVIEKIGAGVRKVWEGILGMIDRAAKAAKTVGGWVGLGDEEVAAAQAAGNPTGAVGPPEAAIAAARGAVGVTNTPLSAISGAAAAAGGQGPRTVTINTGDLTVNTQATDPQGVATAVGKSLESQMRDAIDQMDDGVAG